MREERQVLPFGFAHRALAQEPRLPVDLKTQGQRTLFLKWACFLSTSSHDNSVWSRLGKIYYRVLPIRIPAHDLSQPAETRRITLVRPAGNQEAILRRARIRC